MKYWDELLYPEVLATIRGQRYLMMTDKEIADELIALAKRAINNFLFPNVTLNYAFTSDPDNEVMPKRYYFTDDGVGDKEVAVLVAWMKFFWTDFIIASADNFQNLYYDSNIKSYSPGNTLHNLMKAKEEYESTAREIESRYYRTSDGQPTIVGTIDEQ